MNRFAVPAPTSDGLVVIEALDRCAVARVACRQLRDAEAQRALTHLTATAAGAQGRLVLSCESVSGMSLNAARSVATLSHRCRDLGGRLVVLGLSRDELKMVRSFGGRVRAVRTLHDALRVFGARRTPHARRGAA